MKIDFSIKNFDDDFFWISSSNDASISMATETNFLTSVPVAPSDSEALKWHTFDEESVEQNSNNTIYVYSSEDDVGRFQYLESSINNSIAMNLPEYNKIFDFLSEIEEEEIIERSAIDTTRDMITWMLHNNILPPVVMPQQPEAVVLGWKSPSSSYAITVTENEFGYVILNNNNSLKIVHSQSMDKLNYWMKING